MVALSFPYWSKGCGIYESQLVPLLEKIAQLQDAPLQLDLQSQLLAYLPLEKRRRLIEQIWNRLPGQKLPVEVRAAILLRLFPHAQDIEENISTPFMAVLDMARNLDSTDARTRSLIALSKYLPSEMMLSMQRSVMEAMEHLPDDTSRTSSLTHLCEILVPELFDTALDFALRIHAPDERVRALAALARILPAERISEVQNAALEAIEGIVGEEAAVEALIAFAPHLDFVQDWDVFPEILSRALAIAVNLPRRNFRRGRSPCLRHICRQIYRVKRWLPRTAYRMSEIARICWQSSPMSYRRKCWWQA